MTGLIAEGLDLSDVATYGYRSERWNFVEGEALVGIVAKLNKEQNRYVISTTNSRLVWRTLLFYPGATLVRVTDHTSKNLPRDCRFRFWISIYKVLPCQCDSEFPAQPFGTTLCLLSGPTLLSTTTWFCIEPDFECFWVRRNRWLRPPSNRLASLRSCTNLRIAAITL